MAGRPVATYVFDDERITRPYFEDVRTADGRRLTRNNPPIEGDGLTDHATFHPGLWLAFGDINGTDTWRNLDPIRHDGFVAPPEGGPGHGSFTARNRYEKAGETFAEEVCRIEVQTRPGGYLLLWDSRFTPVGGTLTFGDQEEMGLGVRLATPLAVVRGGTIRDSAGRRNEPEVWGKQADWCEYFGSIDGRRIGVVLMPDPANFRRSWFHARDYGLLVANPFGRAAFTRGEPSRVEVRPGETLRLGFGVLIADDDWDATAAYRDYLGQLAARREKPPGR